MEKVMEKLVRVLDRCLETFLVTAMALSVLTVLWQVVSRHLLHSPSSFTDELVRYLLVWIGLLGGAYAAGQKLHLAIELLPGRLEPAKRYLLASAIDLVIFLFALAVPGLGGLGLVKLTLELGQKSAALGLPLGWVYLALPLAGLVLMVYSAISARAAWRRSLAAEEAGP